MSDQADLLDHSHNLRVSADIIVRQNIFERLHATLPDAKLFNSNEFLDKFFKKPDDEKERIMDYGSFRFFAETIQPNSQTSLFFDHFAFLSPCSFLLLPRTENECLRDTTLMYYCNKKHLAVQFILKLALFYCEDSNGVISEASFQAFVENELIAASSELKSKLNPSFYPYYSCTVSRKVFFFLDSPRRGFIKLQSFINSKLFLECLDATTSHSMDDSASQNSLQSWFSAESALYMYEKYLELDLDGNGMLSKSELSRFGNGTLTNTFLSRFFEECVSYKNDESSQEEIDYRVYLDLVLILTNISSKPALHILFRILDSRGRGALNVYDFNLFYKDLKAYLDRIGIETPPFEHLLSEIFDMVRPVNSWEITQKDLECSGCAGTVVGILIDATVFIEYENREAVTGVDENDIDAEVMAIYDEEAEAAAISVL
ncbi:Serine/threonine-protein phosphatase 2A regulatory subunit B'' subunit gamma [Galdieria sulphuraria]|uniref:Protein phosphatase 2 (Formerly 2A), regulatory subunit B n=1 Tax=Galdieria sulphuraria TaxID=130081 RepID=M2WRK5_GALSU|nr:protein phosphatase 2 (formerly 2A), regulatory subunit B'' [Galdieria sulphuraria]EME26445.1 protein phosphatase 2 (formerly 2A), regulatory subunit B'' [Galdieria sulphuraria]GJD12316.1 Serine/threonine-protein phosphatase 2A regulatory subunit B'' subunit gamma [Galdieria sulphuraria]|eukprot:XP_005702965.1 protein phosphatase 2 (formerly 2A), regulatory subunit B'' [Galdieria sulphuraria]